MVLSVPLPETSAAIGPVIVASGTSACDTLASEYNINNTNHSALVFTSNILLTTVTSTQSLVVQ